MTRSVVPISNLSRRLPEAGRIRFGVKTERAMKAIDRFRFTSADKDALDLIAQRYGGKVQPWSDPKAPPGQCEVITEASEIAVVLPPDPIDVGYELWGGGGRERSCDGLTCTTTVKGPDGPEPAEQPCICDAKGTMACKPYLRLNVILPDVPFTGTWRLETKSWNAVHELPGMVDLVLSLQSRGLAKALLKLDKRTKIDGGQTKRFIVPTLGTDQSVEALAAGMARVGSLPTSEAVAELEAAPDDEIIEAEIVSTDAGQTAVDHQSTHASAGTDRPVCSLCDAPLVGAVTKVGSTWAHRECHETSPVEWSEHDQRPF